MHPRDFSALSRTDVKLGSVSNVGTKRKAFPDSHGSNHKLDTTERLVKNLPAFVAKQADGGHLFGLHNYRAFAKRNNMFATFESGA